MSDEDLRARLERLEHGEARVTDRLDDISERIGRLEKSESAANIHREGFDRRLTELRSHFNEKIEAVSEKIEEMQKSVQASVRSLNGRLGWGVFLLVSTLVAVVTDLLVRLGSPTP